MNTRQAAPTAAGTAASNPALAVDPVAEAAKLMVHAYRRQPHMQQDQRTGLMAERPVEVVFMGEKVLFASNEHGHIVAEVKNQATYDRLVKEIPEAYIPYAGGDNIPEVKILAAEHKAEQRPDGDFVLSSVGADGKTIYKVLDDLSDDEVRAFATEVGLTDEQTPEVLKGETLKRAVFNLLAGSAS